MRFDDVFRDGEAQARPPEIPRSSLVDAVEPLEDPGEMLRGDPRSLRGHLDVALGNALRMERLIDDLLELSRAESGAVPLEKEEAFLSSFLARVADQHRPSAHQAGKTLEVEAGGGGLGPSITNHIVESHGGTIRVESRIGVGTRFVIRIPGTPGPLSTTS